MSGEDIALTIIGVIVLIVTVGVLLYGDSGEDTFGGYN